MAENLTEKLPPFIEVSLRLSPQQWETSPGNWRFGVYCAQARLLGAMTIGGRVGYLLSRQISLVRVARMRSGMALVAIFWQGDWQILSAMIEEVVETKPTELPTAVALPMARRGVAIPLARRGSVVPAKTDLVEA
jgi:hypothetical protein